MKKQQQQQQLLLIELFKFVGKRSSRASKGILPPKSHADENRLIEICNSKFNLAMSTCRYLLHAAFNLRLLKPTPS